MRATMRALLAGSLIMGVALAIGAPSARAQMGMRGGGRSLGGYGASTISFYYGGTSTTYIPYNGEASGFIPYNRGFGDAMNAQSVLRRIPETPIGGIMTPETPIGGASLTGGMGAAPRGGMGPGSRTRTYMPFGYVGGMGMGTGIVSMPTPGSSATRRALSGPGFGYPFRMPPSLTGSGPMSMP